MDEYTFATYGDSIADVPVEGRYSLVFVLANTFFMLTTQEDQVRCFRNVAAHLERSGAFVVECFVPDLTMYDQGRHLSAQLPDLSSVRVDISVHNAVEQVIDFRHLLLTEQGVRMYPGRLRYTWPMELDLMARLAGLRLRDRWGDWDKSEFTSHSPSHVSVYEKADG